MFVWDDILLSFSVWLLRLGCVLVLLHGGNLSDSQVSFTGTLQKSGFDVSVVKSNFSDSDESLYCFNVANIES